MRTVALLLSLTAAICAQPNKTRNVILVTADGLRWQDLFSGIDPLLMNEKTAGMQREGAKELRERLVKDTPEARREALMPFFWKELAPRGIVLGDPARESSVTVTNSFRVSYPGYSEILTGRAQDEAIRGNTPIQNPTETVLEFVRRKLGLSRTQVALIGTWDTFHVIGEHTPGSIFINAGPRRLDIPNLSPRLRELNDAQFDALVPWEGERSDYFTFEIALAYLEQFKPRLMHIAFGETDDWAHDRRYDRVLESISYFDRSLRKLWSTLQRMPAYRDRTTLIIATDHGRGGTLADFSSHGEKVPAADRIWIVVAGPDTPPTGEAHGTSNHQRDIAPTILRLLGVAPDTYAGVKGTAISAAFR
jgi:Sulfatase